MSATSAMSMLFAQVSLPRAKHHLPSPLDRLQPEFPLILASHPHLNPLHPTHHPLFPRMRLPLNLPFRQMAFIKAVNNLGTPRSLYKASWRMTTGDESHLAQLSLPPPLQHMISTKPMGGHSRCITSRAIPTSQQPILLQVLFDRERARRTIRVYRRPRLSRA